MWCVWCVWCVWCGGVVVWWWSRRDVYDMSLTMCHNSPAPNYGGRVPVDTTPGPVPVYRAYKLTPSAHQRDDELLRTTRTTTRCNCGSTAVYSTSALESWTCTRNIDHLVSLLQLESFYGTEQDQGNLPLHHDRDDDGHRKPALNKPHQSLNSLTHEHESAVEPSTALKYDGP